LLAVWPAVWLAVRLAVLLAFPAKLQVFAIFLLSLQLGSKNHKETASKTAIQTASKTTILYPRVFAVLLAVLPAVFLEN